MESIILEVEMGIPRSQCQLWNCEWYISRLFVPIEKWMNGYFDIVFIVEKCIHFGLKNVKVHHQTNVGCCQIFMHSGQTWFFWWVGIRYWFNLWT